ncbi:transglycosylase SLT domain-containing protein [Streptomyces sp. Li-HN-5-11]|uniref:transglycosylase SLT domain-containing protein n=1 Tax=Streptomyces sp. Li-HN-5-11 TaxID=3075432 RepID=UPI0028A84280|nr:transglycosylase SLT domain-containing protein [Streptomyces sp. Li-HN-5-11]WNM29495.1 transglycosylase SLT domain-containing protein [Streptomyces sp. Li-HN-5-11]
MPANGQHSRSRAARIARAVAAAGTGAAVLALPLIGATSASAATTASATTVASTVSYPNNLDGWIRASLAVMAEKGIPGTYNGIYRNVIRESSGNPMAINLWDSNAAAGTPSKGLLQVIAPTFAAYHVSGTSWDIYDPVANITAACNYAAHRYGSIDNVFGAY